MILTLKNVLNPSQISAVKNLLQQGEFTCGKQTAGWHAKEVKSNLQWQSHDQLQQELHLHLTTALSQHPQFSAATYAKKLMPFLVSKCSNGGGYGEHVDDALMSGDDIIRTDISCTLALSNPQDYQGGELVMNLGGTQVSHKLEAGDAIIYPSTTLHKVMPVTQGERIVALTWIESHINQAQQREMLYDLDSARKAIMQSQGKTPAFDLISKTYANLLRLWAQS